MDEHPSEETSGLSRRQMLKRGAAVGGALVWTVPAVQSLSGTAFAQTISPGGEGCPEGTDLHSFKIEVNDGVVQGCVGPTAGEDNPAPGQSSCNFPGYGSGANGCEFVLSTSTSDGGKCLKVFFAESCDISTATVKVKSGVQEGFCANAPQVTLNTAENSVTVCLNQQNISFVAFQICC
jgi:hypothetical protein